MEKILRHVPVSISAIASFLLFCLLCWSVFFKGQELGFLENSAPAWIQAVGSILAIIAAAWIAQRQSNHARELEDYKQAKLERQKLQVVMALMARSHGLAEDICRAYESQSQSDIDQISPPLMEDTHHALMALPVFDIPEWQLSLDVLIVSRSLASLKEQVLALESADSHEELKNRLENLNGQAVEVRNIALDSVKICKNKIKERDKFLGL
ncbi:hypothetical protein thsps21_11000 [Pseudomonas sp. No.21]|uniref:hypothetical protein n=1 Tax=Pseudomonas tohonis TaxID=2725477 RepID=UPI001F21D889|nr:hypothetical protein [Pseudomonas tohonis]GJN50140.1 hypothetical protein TUM20249_61260 [Pseudomonas tohonis]